MQNKYDPSSDLYKRLEEKLVDTVLSKSYEIYSEEEEKIVPYENEEILLVDEEDVCILIEREVHFSGSFPAMISYYSDEDRKGIHRDISYNRIQELWHIEENLQKNLAAILLQGADAEKVRDMKKIYEEMRKVLSCYKPEEHKALPLHILLLECILSEEPVEMLVQKYALRFSENPALLHSIIQSDMLYSHLAPGYGTAPLFAIHVLKAIHHTESMAPLFSRLYDIQHEENPEIDEAILEALRSFGEPVKQKMMSFVEMRPFGRDGEKALQVLIEFLPDSDISRMAIREIMKQDISSPQILEYLALLLTKTTKEEMAIFLEWVEKNRKVLPKSFILEMERSL